MPKTKKYFYQLSIEAAAEKLKTDLKKGLSSKEAERRIETYGLNELKEGKRRPVFFRFLDQFKDLLIVVLIVAGFLSYYLKDFQGGTILLLIVLANAIIGFYQEYKAEQILASLKAVIRDKAIVIRNGRRMEVDQKNLVPGDLVYLEEGSSVPADIRLTEVTHFSTNDFILTGESIPQEKFAERVIDKSTTLTNQDNVVFMGLTIAKGNAYGIVFGTGMKTAIGRIATDSESISHDASPLQKEIDSLAKTLTKLAGIVAVVLFIINLSLNYNDPQGLGHVANVSILFAIGVAAACVPQGLPAQISVALSLGVGRLAKKKAIVKKLSAVETLGSTTVICSDKTGTITKNEMTITYCVMLKEGVKKSVENRIFEVTGDGYKPKGAVFENGKKVDKRTSEELKRFFQDGFLASHGRAEAPDKNHADWYAIGDPTEAAFTPLIMKAALNPDDLEDRFPIHSEIPFDSERKRMTIIRQHKGKYIGYMKGAIESVLAVCNQARIDGKLVKMTPKIRQILIKEASHFSDQALRVIALAYRDFSKSEKEFTIKKDEQNFIFVGFVAMIDPPRVGVKEAIEHAYLGGMRIMMITGDNEVTAHAIARKIGMDNLNGELPIYNGDQIKKLSDAKIKKILLARSVIFSRVSPHDKFRLVTLLKAMGEVVAVTGDGVNDTLSLKRADIGVSMGRMGSEVAKEVSEVVLLDDNFHTLTTAITEGRTIFKNLKKTILATVTANMGELSCVLIGFIGMAYGMPAPITAVQILAVDLIAELLPLTALTFDKGDKKLMTDPPRKLKDHIINKYSLSVVTFFGLINGAVAYLSFYIVYHQTGNLGQAQAATYGGLVLCQLINILSARSTESFFSRYLFTNAKLWLSIFFSGIAVWTLINVPVINIWFDFESLGWSAWATPLVGAMTILFLHEVMKLMIKYKILRPLI